jgi:carboxypeptidase C (cathepsin A)
MLAATHCALAQGQEAKPGEAKPAAETPPAPAPKEESSVTDHQVRIGGQTIAYKATAATVLLKNDKEEPIALVYSTAYTKSDVKDLSARPLAFLYNGGPGSSSVWLHMGSFSPKRVSTANADYTAGPPFQLNDNPFSLLDKADLVFIDPVGTGFSHAVGKAQNKDFWGITQDVHSLAQFIHTYVSRNDRWNSPKFLIGESYGTFRSVALCNYLLQHDNMQFNGIVLVSNVLDLSTISFPPGQDLAYILHAPTYAAVAWYHKVLKDRPADLTAFLADARKFATGEYAAALMKGAALSDAAKAEMAKKLARYTGLSEEYLIRANLRVNEPQFAMELQRMRGLTTGRLDARFSGPTPDLLSEYAQSDPQSDAISGAFVSAFNSYVRNELKFGQDKVYYPQAEFNGAQWDFKQGGGFGFPGAPNVEPDLVQALISNPHLRVEVENGYFDLATPFLGTEYTMDHLDGLPANLRANITLKYYEAGHMMYVLESELAKLKANVAAFIDGVSKP